MEKGTEKRLIVLIFVLSFILMCKFFLSGLINRQRIYMYYGMNELDIHQLKILDFCGIDKVDKIKIHSLPDLKRPDLNEAFKMLYEERVNKPADQDYFYNYPEYFDLPFLEAINFSPNYGTLRVGSIAEKESILYYSKDYASYNYYFTLSKVNEKYKLFVFRIKDSVKGDEKSKASYLMHHSKGVLR